MTLGIAPPAEGGVHANMPLTLKRDRIWDGAGRFSDRVTADFRLGRHDCQKLA